MTSTLSLVDYAALSPLLIVLAGALVMLLLETFTQAASDKLSSGLSFAFMAAALVATTQAPASTNDLLISWIKFDPLSRLFTMFFLVIGMGTVLLSSAFFKNFQASRGEYYFLLFSSIFGLILIGGSADFLTLFLGLETLSISLYVLCGYMKHWEISNEASVKYFLLGSLAAAFLLYGIALIYGAIGSTSFDTLLNGFHELKTTQDRVLFMSGIGLVTLGLAFKAAIVPFHVWAPDVYEGAPTPVTAFMAMGTKVGAFAAFIRVFLLALPQFDVHWNEAIAILAYPTLIYSNILALKQTQLRRFFAYSGISHAGFLLIPLAAGTPNALQAMVYYMIVYVTATFGAFAVLAFLDQRPHGVVLRDLYGLFRRSPALAAILSLCLLTLAGIPPTAGFFAKFFVFKVAFHAGYYSLVVVGLLTTVLSAYYYLRIVGVMLTEHPSEATAPHRSLPAAIVGVAAFAAILVLSLYPGPLLR